MAEEILLGGVRVDSPIWLAPLAGVTTRTFREFHRRLGASLTHTEMVSAVGLSYMNAKTRALLGDPEEAGPIVLQLFAPDAESLLRGGEIALTCRGYDALEINMACPMPKVTKKGCGAALMQSPQVAAGMTARLAGLGLPVWVKTRLCDSRVHPYSTAEFCAALIEAGAALISIHGRTPAQRYEGSSDKEAVCHAARGLPAPVFASGDYNTPEDARVYIDGGCAGVLAARGALRDAYLIPKTRFALGYPADKRYVTPTVADQIDALIELGRAGVEREGEAFTLVLARRMLGGLFRGFPGAASLRGTCAAHKTWLDLETKLTELKAAYFGGADEDRRAMPPRGGVSIDF